MTETITDPDDPRRVAPACARNREPILAVLKKILPGRGLALEVASGSGEHVQFFAQNFPGLTFQPTDVDAAARASIDAWTAREGRKNVLPAKPLDASRPPWPLSQADAILCVNMTHISPFAATEGLFRQAYELLSPGAPLYVYGPFWRAGVAPAPSNLAFDESLRAQNPAWGLRDVAQLAALAEENDFSTPEIIEMPANNLSLIFRRF